MGININLPASRKFLYTLWDMFQDANYMKTQSLGNISQFSVPGNSNGCGEVHFQVWEVFSD